MGNGTHLATWVDRETKERFSSLAQYQGLTHSGLLKRMIELALRSADAASLDKPFVSDETTARASRLTVRLRPDDQVLLRERAAARGMAPATYVSVLVRAHLRALTPLPKEELMALRGVAAELGAIGRNLNQIARMANQGASGIANGRDEVRSMLKIAAGLRDHVKGLVRANERSWSTGYDAATR